MSAPFPKSIKCKFIAKNWSESPFHEMTGVGNLSHANIINALSGDMEADGTLAYLLSYPNIEGGDEPFIGYERIVGRIGSCEGSFVIKHDGTFSPTSGVNGKLEIVPDSGTQGFAGVGGRGFITAKAGEHGGEYTLTLEKVA